MARRLKRVSRSRWVEPALAWLAAAYIRLVHRSGRWRVECDPQTAELVRARGPLIGAFWHGRLLLMAAAWRRLVAELGVSQPVQAYVLSSDHRDGRFMARTTAHFGLITVFGSTSRGAAGLFKLGREIVERGEIAVITPDGPRGPRMRAKPGIVRLAMITGVPVVPVTFAASNQRLLGSWDRFALALPLARGVMAFGAPFQIPADAEVEEGCAELERRLNQLTAKADRAVGRAPVEPG